MTNKLFLLKLLSGTTVYAIAANPRDAYAKAKQDLDARGVGDKKDRKMRSIELIAEDVVEPDCGVRLYG